MPPATKKRRVSEDSEDPLTNGHSTVPTAPYTPATSEEKNQWQGFCEIESEPAFFNVMLKDFGVKGVKVQEVFGLDEELLAMLPKPVYGLIFLFRYRSDDENKQEASCPDHVWFANQTHEFACATVSLLNIVNNIADADIGENLRSFREFTKDFTPALRGDQIGNFDFVKSIHNSFARKMDMLCIDLGLENRFDDRNEKSQPKKAESKSSNKKKSKTVTVTDDDYVVDDAAFHFIAFVPIQGEVWKLDGLDRQPEKIGAYEADADWLNVVTPELATRMAQYEESQIEFGLLSLVKDPLTEHCAQLAIIQQTLAVVEAQLAEVNPNSQAPAVADQNGSALSQTSALTEISNEAPIAENATNGSHTPHPAGEEVSAEFKAKLLIRQKELLAEKAMLDRFIVDEEAAARDDEQRAWERRHDYGPLISTWLKMLAGKEGLVKDLIEEYR